MKKYYLILISIYISTGLLLAILLASFFASETIGGTIIFFLSLVYLFFFSLSFFWPVWYSNKRQQEWRDGIADEKPDGKRNKFIRIFSLSVAIRLFLFFLTAVLSFFFAADNLLTLFSIFLIFFFYSLFFELIPMVFMNN